MFLLNQNYEIKKSTPLSHNDFLLHSLKFVSLTFNPNFDFLMTFFYLGYSNKKTSISQGQTYNFSHNFDFLLITLCYNLDHFFFIINYYFNS